MFLTGRSIGAGYSIGDVDQLGRLADYPRNSDSAGQIASALHQGAFDKGCAGQSVIARVRTDPKFPEALGERCNALSSAVAAICLIHGARRSCKLRRDRIEIG